MEDPLSVVTANPESDQVSLACPCLFQGCIFNLCACKCVCCFSLLVYVVEEMKGNKLDEGTGLALGEQGLGCGREPMAQIF